MELLRFSSQQAKKRWPPFLPDRATQSGNPLRAMSQKVVSSSGKFSTLKFSQIPMSSEHYSFSDIWRMRRL